MPGVDLCEFAEGHEALFGSTPCVLRPYQLHLRDEVVRVVGAGVPDAKLQQNIVVKPIDQPPVAKWCANTLRRF